jgi:3-hydroxyacyl-CoA dehydrogenase / enoyl-CoA hydratase / 3-hydroxybutyryl-CoA epimerase
MKTIKLDIDGNGIATITIDLPERSMNVLTPELIAELNAAIDGIAGDAAVKGAVLASGKEAFCAGADLLDLAGVFEQTVVPAAAYAKYRGLQDLCRRIESCGKPMAAAINGSALGGGLELCLACHYRVAVDDAKTKLGLPEVLVGLMPGGGGTQRLPRLIGIAPALPLLLRGTHLAPKKAAELRIVDQLVARGGEIAAAKQWIADRGDPVQAWDKKGFQMPGGAGLMNPKVTETLMVGVALLEKTTNHNYPAPIAIMSAVYEGSVVPIETALAIESKYFALLLTDPVARNMTRTLFVNKGAADKLARRPRGVPKSKVEKLGILGAGMMGAGIAFVSARAGMQVVLLDTELAKAEHGKDYSRSLTKKMVEQGRMSAGDAAALLERIQVTTDYKELAGSDLVIEAVFEDRRIKADVTARAEAEMPQASIFASNTSTLPITGLAAQSSRPEQFIGIHFFSPVDKMPLVEVIVGRKTGEVAVARALDYVQQLRKTPIVVNDSRGFYTSRVFSTFTREGMSMLSEGVNPALIENVAKHAGMPVGPLAVTDEVSLELAHAVTQQTRKDLGSAYVATAADAVMEKMVETLDRRGKRFGKGFYDYPENGRKRLWPGLAEAFPRASEQPAPEEIRKRLLYIQAIETVRCLEEGVLTHPADGDIGSVFGWGFPGYTGGTLSLIETVGLQEFVAQATRLAEAYGPRFQPPGLLQTMATKGQRFYDPSGAAAAR